MDEAQYLADRVAVITHGEIVAEGPPDARRARHDARPIRFRLPGGPRARLHSARSPPPTGRFEVSDRRRTTRRRLVARADRLGARAAASRARAGRGRSRRRLEDVYLELTGGEEGVGVSDGRTDAPAGPVHEQGVLAQPRLGVLHVRVPADVPGDLHGAAGQRRDVRIKGTDLQQSTYYVAAMAAFGVITACYTNIAISVTLQARRRDPEAHPGNAAAGLVVPRRARGPRHARGADPRRHHARCSGGPSTTATFPTGVALARVRRDVPGRRRVLRRARRSRSPAAIPNADAAPPIVNATSCRCCSCRASSSRSATTRRQWISVHRRHLPGEALRRRDAGRVPRAGRVRRRSDWQAFPFRGATSLVIALWGVAGLLLAVAVLQLGAPEVRRLC